MNLLEQAAVAAYPELRRLIALRESGGWVFQPIQARGELALVVGARVWPLGWTDELAIRDLGDAKAYRCDPAGDEVWGREGSLTQVIDALMELPAPGTPGAPTFVLGRRPTLWTPGR